MNSNVGQDTTSVNTSRGFTAGWWLPRQEVLSQFKIKAETLKQWETDDGLPVYQPNTKEFWYCTSDIIELVMKTHKKE